MTGCRQTSRRPAPREHGHTVLSLQRSIGTLTLTRMPFDHAEFDAGYLARLKSGDIETGHHFEAYFSNVIWLKLRNRVRARHLIDEIRQETFTRVRNDADVVTEERKRMVRDVLAELSVKDSDLLRMVFLEEGDRSVISKHFSVDSDYLRVLLHRAKERFREVMK